MKYSRIPSTITRSFWDGSVAIAENRKMEVLIYQKDNRREIKFPVGDRESRVAILSCHAPDGKETVISIYDKEAGKITLSINDPGGRKESIRRAIKDLMARTLTRKEENKGNDFHAAIEDVLLEKINNWLDDSRTNFCEKEFDKWHNDACKAVLEVLQDYYTNNNGTKVEYGKAQKIVNMTMKGLYCLKDADQKDRHFEHCHIPLDSFTLEWFKRAIVEQEGLSKGKVDSWSTLQYGEINKPTYMVTRKKTDETENQDNTEADRDASSQEYYTYNYIVNRIRDYFDDTNKNNPYKGLTPFQAEFYIWQEIQLHLATEALFGQDIGRDAAMDYADQHYAVKPNGNEFGKATRNFSLYTDIFRKLPLEDKMHFLKERMEQMLTTINNDPSTSESFEVRFEYENAKECLDAFSNGIAIFIPDVDNIEENKKYTTIRNYIIKYNKPDYVLESKNEEYFLVIYKESVNKANNLVNYIKNQKLAKFVWCKDSKSCYKKVYGCSAPVRRHTIQLTACEGGLELTIGDKNSKS